MSKLFNMEETPKLKLSTEQFLQLYQSSSVVSQESISDFLYSLKDSVFNIGDKLFSSDLEKAAIDAMRNKFEVLNVGKRLHMSELADEVVTVPESFKGRYVDYQGVLTEASELMFADTVQLLNNVKMAIGGFINEYKEGGVLSVYGVSYAKNSEALYNKQRKLMAKFFTVSKATSKAKVTDVIRSMGDMERIYKDIPQLSASCSKDKVMQIQKLVAEIDEIVDVVIEQNQESGILSNNSSAKRQLINMIHVAAKNVEFCGYLYANTLFFYNGVQSLSQAILRVGGR